MNIAFEKIHRIATALEQYRRSGSIKFDCRDAGNYNGSSWTHHAAMLEAADPTGLALGMLLAEMIQATIKGSLVKLERVLREPDFVAQLAAVQQMERDLNFDIDAPRARLVHRLTESLAKVSSRYQPPSTREVAICLRDAVYSMDRGLTLRWLQCADTPTADHVPLCTEIWQFKSLPDFLDTLRTKLPIGAHLAKVGANQTVIGMKQPARIAYLSSMSICYGRMYEDRSSGYHMAENFDLETAAERYPEWATLIKDASKAPGVVPAPAGADSQALCHISLLPRDRLLWVAMVVEMAAQKMASTSPRDVALTETMQRALPNAPTGANLPALIEPNWSAAELSIDATFASFRFAAWEEAFLRPALDGLTEDAFCRISDIGHYGITLASKEIVPWPNRYEVCDDDWRNYVQMTALSPDLAGTQKEVEAGRQDVFARNLLNWLMAWGNHRFALLWKEHMPWFQKALENNLPAALSSLCMTWRPPDLILPRGINLYTQNPKRKTFAPNCYFNGRWAVTRVAHFCPMDSSDLAGMLGLKSEAELPSFLHGWSRILSWTTANRFEGHARCKAPFDSQQRWCFAIHSSGRSKDAILEATVFINDASLPEEHTS